MRRTLLRRRRDKGAVSVEFVFIVPILLVLIFGIIQFAYYFFQVQQGAFAAREAARQAAVGTRDCTELISFVVERVGAPTPVYVTLTPNPSPPEIGGTINVLVEFQAADFGFPFIPYPNDAAVVEDADTRVENIGAGNSSTYAGCTNKP